MACAIRLARETKNHRTYRIIISMVFLPPDSAIILRHAKPRPPTLRFYADAYFMQYTIFEFESGAADYR